MISFSATNRLPLWLLAAASALALATAAAAEDDDVYRVHVRVDFTAVDRDRGCVPVRLEVEQDGLLLRHLEWTAEDSHLDVKGDGLTMDQEANRYSWTLEDDGGSIGYCVVLDHRRSEETGFDSRLRRDWAVFRGDDLVPPVRSRMRKNSRSDTRLHFLLPRGWSTGTRYPTDDFERYRIEDPDRRFDRPTGWMTAGEIGRRLDVIADTRVLVAGPVDQDFERLEILVLLGYTLDSVRAFFPEFPHRLAIIGAGEDMWLGALSGPGSMFIHSDRPLVSGNATSTLLHELGHVGLGRSAERGADWIVEGLVEYLSFTILYETGGLTDKRYKKVLRDLRRWGKDAEHLDAPKSTGAITARAVTVFAALHAELGNGNFLDLVNRLADGDGRLDLGELRATASRLLGSQPESLEDLPLKHSGQGKNPGPE